MCDKELKRLTSEKISLQPRTFTFQEKHLQIATVVGLNFQDMVFILEKSYNGNADIHILV